MNPWWTLVAVSLGGMMVTLDGTALTIAGPNIAHSVGASVPELQWIANSYLLALAAGLFPAGRLADRVGRRRMFVVGVVGFGLASLLIAAATTVWLLITLRTLQGLSGALLQPAALALLRAAFPPHRFDLAIGVWGGASALTIAAGPVIAGFVVQQFGWRVVFMVNAPVAALTLVMVWIAVAESRAAGAPGRRRDLIRAPGVLLGAVLTALSYFSLFGLLFFLTLYLQDIRGLGPMSAGEWLLPFTAVIVVSAPIGGALTGRYGPRLPAAVGLLLVAAGMLGLLVLDADTTRLQMLPAALVMGLGTGIAMVAAIHLIVTGAPAGESALASALQQVATQLGGVAGILTLGLVMPGTVEPVAFVAGLHTAVILAAVVVTAGALLAFLKASASPPDRAAAVEGEHREEQPAPG